MVFPSFSYGFPMVFSFSYGFPMVFPWFSHGSPPAPGPGTLPDPGAGSRCQRHPHCPGPHRPAGSPGSSVSKYLSIYVQIDIDTHHVYIYVYICIHIPCHVYVYIYIYHIPYQYSVYVYIIYIYIYIHMCVCTCIHKVVDRKTRSTGLLIGCPILQKSHPGADRIWKIAKPTCHYNGKMFANSRIPCSVCFRMIVYIYIFIHIYICI